MPESLREAFFQFRLDAPAEIEVPGTAAVRRTVGRRRTTRMGALALLLVGAVGGVGYAGGMAGGASNEPASSADGGPAAPADRTTSGSLYAAVARNALPSYSSQVTGGSGALMSDMLDVSEGEYRAGSYTLAVVCAGTGSVRAIFTVNATAVAQTVTCSAAPRVVSIDLDALVAGTEISVVLVPDDAAIRSAGFAYAVLKN
jgi:hypothetical protein